MEQPKFTVQLFKKKPFEVMISNGDLVRWDMDRASRGWPEMGSASNLWGSYVCFLASRRTGKYNMTWENWIDDVENIEFISTEDVDPTEKEAEDGSSVS